MGLTTGFGVSQKQAGGGSGPPFALNSAENGLRVDPTSKKIVLGGDGPFQVPLLSDRYIDMSGFGINLWDLGGGPYGGITAINGGGMSSSIGTQNMILSGNFFQLNDAANNIGEMSRLQLRFVSPGNFQTILSKTGLNITDGFLAYDVFLNSGIWTVQGTAGNKKYFAVDGFSINPTVAIGDLNPSLTGAKLTVDINNNKIVVDSTAHTMKFNMNGTDGFTGTVSPVTSITVKGGIVTAVT